MEEEYHPSFLRKCKNFINECARVLKVTKKPSGLEFKTIVKVSGLGIVVIGLMGFIITLIKQILFK